MSLLRVLVKLCVALLATGCLGFRINRKAGSRSTWPTQDDGMLQALYSNPSYLGSGCFGEVWKARLPSGAGVVVKFAKKKQKHDIKLVKDDAEAVAKLKFECNIANILHSRGFQEDCIHDVPVEGNAPAFIALTFMGDLTIGDMIKVNESNEIHVWDHFDSAEKQQIMYHLLNDLVLMWQPTAISHNDIMSAQLVWNGIRGVGPNGVRVDLIDFGEASQCDDNDYLGCLIEGDEDEGPGAFYLTTSKDLHTFLIHWVSAAVPEDLAYPAQTLVHGLFELPVEFQSLSELELPPEFQSLTELELVLRIAAEQVEDKYWFRPLEELTSIIPTLMETSKDFLEFLFEISRVMWRGCHLEGNTSEVASKALREQHEMLKDLIQTSPYTRALAVAAS